MRKSALFVVVVAAVLVWLIRPTASLSDSANRLPAQAALPTIKKIDLLASIGTFKRQLDAGKLTEKNCAPFLEDTFRQLYDVQTGMVELSVLRATGLAIQNALFDTTLALREKQRALAPFLEKNDECLRAFRDAFRASRILGEIVGEHALGYPGEDTDEQSLPLEGSTPYLHVNPKFGKLELRSGDVLLSRGSAFVSAAIARMAGLNSNSSHVEIVYIDPKDGKKWTVGAHIEVGSIVRPIEAYLDEEKVRVSVFRHPDAALAARAAEKIFQRVQTYREENGENIPYDFRMDMSDSKELFCSELISSAFAVATDGTVKVPQFRSRLFMVNRDFLDRLGIKVESTFMPADIELDTRFELVGEWRDFGLTNRSHMKDAVLTSIYNWMERERYILKATSAIDLKTVAAWHLRRWPVFSAFLKSSHPTNMTQETMGVISTLNETSEALFGHLEKRNSEHRAAVGAWLTPAEMLEELEAFRKSDLKTYQVYQKTSGYDPLATKPAFHLLFRPK